MKRQLKRYTQRRLSDALHLRRRGRRRGRGRAAPRPLPFPPPAPRPPWPRGPPALPGGQVRGHGPPAAGGSLALPPFRTRPLAPLALVLALSHLRLGFGLLSPAFSPPRRPPPAALLSRPAPMCAPAGPSSHSRRRPSREISAPSPSLPPSRPPSRPLAPALSPAPRRMLRARRRAASRETRGRGPRPPGGPVRTRGARYERTAARMRGAGGPGRGVGWGLLHTHNCACFVHTRAHKCAHARTHARTDTRVRANARTRTHARTHAHKHAHTLSLSLSLSHSLGSDSVALLTAMKLVAAELDRVQVPAPPLAPPGPGPGPPPAWMGERGGGRDCPRHAYASRGTVGGGEGRITEK